MTTMLTLAAVLVGLAFALFALAMLLGLLQTERRAREEFTLRLLQRDRDQAEFLHSVFAHTREQDSQHSRWVLAASSEFFQHQAQLQCQAVFSFLQLLISQLNDDPPPSEQEFPGSQEPPTPDPELPQ